MDLADDRVTLALARTEYHCECDVFVLEEIKRCYKNILLETSLLTLSKLKCCLFLRPMLIHFGLSSFNATVRTSIGDLWAAIVYMLMQMKAN